MKTWVLFLILIIVILLVVGTRTLFHSRWWRYYQTLQNVDWDKVDRILDSIDNAVTAVQDGKATWNDAKEAVIEGKHRFRDLRRRLNFNRWKDDNL